jgi:hypothetical protein
MILYKFSDILIPVEEILEKLEYRNIECKNKINFLINNKKLIHEFDDDIDFCILHAINYFDNLNSFVIFGKNKNDGYKYYLENFKNDYILYGIKYLKLKSNMISKIMYQLLFSRSIIKTKQDLSKLIETEFKYLFKYKEEYIDITILLICKRDLKKKYPSDDIIETDFNIYIPNTKESIWNCASTFFSNSSLKFLEKQNFDYFLTKDMEVSKKMFLTYRSWLFSNIDIPHQSQFMLYSSVILYLLGHRSMNDIDLYVHTIPNSLNDKLKILKDTKDFNLDFQVKNTENWPNYWDVWLDEWSQKCGAKYFEEILGNPKYHFYFLGVKIISLECDVTRRVIRNRPRAIADLIALRKRYSYSIIIPSIPEKQKEYIPLENKSEEEISELIKKGYILNIKNKELCIENDTDINKFINTIIYALQTRYRMVFTPEEIKRELNMINEIVEQKKIKKIVKKLAK